MTRLPRTAVITSIATVLGGISGAVLALLIGTKLGSSARTDGFFAAFALYSVVGILATSWKTNIIAALVSTPQTFDRFDRLCGGITLMFLAVGVLFVGLGGPLASLVTGHGSGPAHDTARTALLVLWPAAGGQLFAGMGAAMFNVLDKNSQSATFYALGSLATIVAFLALEPALGVDALAVAIASGTVVTVVLTTLWLIRAGWRPSPRVLLKPRLGSLWLLSFSSVSNLIAQLLYAISVAVAARTGSGAATIFSFAYFGQALVKALVTLSLPVVLATPLASTWDRTAASLRPYVDDTLRIGLVLLIPVVAAVVFLGEDVGNAVLSKLSAGQVHEMIIVFLILSAGIVLTQVSIVETLALATLRRYGALALMSLAVLAFHVPASLGAGAIGSVYAVAIAFLLTCIVRTVIVLRMVHGDELVATVTKHVREMIPVAAAAAASFGVGAAVMQPQSAATDGGAFAAGLALFVISTTVFLPHYRMLALRLVRAVRSPAPNVRV